MTKLALKRGGVDQTKMEKASISQTKTSTVPCCRWWMHGDVADEFFFCLLLLISQKMMAEKAILTRLSSSLSNRTPNTKL